MHENMKLQNWWQKRFYFECVPMFLLSTSFVSNVGMVVVIGEIVEHWKRNTLCLLNYLIIILINISITLRKAVGGKSPVFINVAVTVAPNFREQFEEKKP